MSGDARHTQGQALIELLVAMLALVPLVFGVVWIGTLQGVQQATIAAARSVAFECTVRPLLCEPDAARDALAAETRQRFFAHPRIAQDDEGATPDAQDPRQRTPLWVDRRGVPLLERFEDVQVEVQPVSFDSPSGALHAVGRVADDAISRLSSVAGPGRFGLVLEAGLLQSRITVDLARGRSSTTWVQRLLPIPLTFRERLTLLTNAWSASGPYGDAPDSVESRVYAGARLPAVDPAVDAAWLGVRALLGAAGALGLEPAADALRWHAFDVDRLPPGRRGPDAATASLPPVSP